MSQNEVSWDVIMPGKIRAHGTNYYIDYISSNQQYKVTWVKMVSGGGDETSEVGVFGNLAAAKLAVSNHMRDMREMGYSI